MLVLLNRIESIVVIFILMLLFLEIGRRSRLALIKRNPSDSGSIGPVETVIFALLGLLLAFTFTGSWNRFEVRKELITKEANAIKNLFWRADLLDAESKAKVTKLLKEYTSIRASIYRDSTDDQKIEMNYQRGLDLQQKIWDLAVAGCSSPGVSPGCAALVLPAINMVSDVAKSRLMARQNHPPVIIYIMLIILSLFSAFLVGYSMPHGHKRTIYFLGYAAMISLVLYLIFDIEMPRHGLIAVHEADHLIFDVRDLM